MWKDRTIRTLLFTVPLVIFVGIVRPRSADPLVRSKPLWDRFWVVKTHNHRKYDMLILGDSRVYRGVSPEAMRAVLPDYRILNFGYSAGGLNPMMYREAERRLDPESPHKAIVLGVTPGALLPFTATNEHFLQEKTRPREDVYQRLYLNPYLKFFEPIDLRELLLAARGKKPKPKEFYYQEFHDDGWVAARLVPENPEKQLPRYRERFTKESVSEELIRELIEQTKTWVAKGIRVFAYRPPTTRKMVALEEELSGFDEADFVKRFEAAGGVWFSFSVDDYHSYDGSHLRKDSAVLFSKDLAGHIREYIARGGRRREPPGKSTTLLSEENAENPASSAESTRGN